MFTEYRRKRSIEKKSDDDKSLSSKEKKITDDADDDNKRSSSEKSMENKISGSSKSMLKNSVEKKNDDSDDEDDKLSSAKKSVENKINGDDKSISKNSIEKLKNDNQLSNQETQKVDTTKKPYKILTYSANRNNAQDKTPLSSSALESMQMKLFSTEMSNFDSELKSVVIPRKPKIPKEYQSLFGGKSHLSHYGLPSSYSGTL